MFCCDGKVSSFFLTFIIGWSTSLVERSHLKGLQKSISHTKHAASKPPLSRQRLSSLLPSQLSSVDVVMDTRTTPVQTATEAAARLLQQAGLFDPKNKERPLAAWRRHAAGRGRNPPS